ncbi:MAG: carbohydrate binding domain-containing protein [Verrucomicrobiota bacterium]
MRYFYQLLFSFFVLSFGIEISAQEQTSVAASSSPNLIENGDYEKEEGFKTNWAWCDLDAEARISTDSPHGGAHCLKVACSRFKVGSVIWFHPLSKAEKNKVYKVGFYVKGEGIHDFKVSLRKINPNWATYASKTVSPLAEWEYYEFVGISQAEANDLGIFFSFESEGTLWIDDVSVQEVSLPVATPQTTTNFIYNGSFEVENRDELMLARIGGDFPQVDAHIDHKESFLGKRSFQVDAGNKAYTLQPVHAYPLRANCDHILSMYMKADKPAKVDLEVTPVGGGACFKKTVDVGTTWDRYSASGKTTISASGEFYYAITVKDAQVWIDGLHLTEGLELVPYSSPSLKEVSVTIVPAPSKMFVSGDKVKAKIRVSNSEGALSEAPLPLQWKLTDWYGNVETSGTLSLAAGASDAELIVEPKKLGMYRLEVAPPEGTFREDIFAVTFAERPFKKPSMFGAHFRAETSTLDMARKAGIRFERGHWPEWTKWSYMEPTKGQWELDKVRETVDGLKSNQMELMASFGMTPRWAYPAKRKNFNRYQTVYPAEIQDWRDYAKKVASEFPEVNYFEIFNEPAVAIFFDGTKEDLMKLFSEAVKGVKSVKPDAKIVGFANGWHGTMNQNLPLLQETKLLPLLDVLSVHEYFFSNVERALDFNKEYVDEANKFLSENGKANVEIWNDEYNVKIGSFKSVYSDQWKKSGKEGALDMVKVNSFLTSAGMSKLFLYLMEPGSDVSRMFEAGVLDFDKTPRPSLVSYAALAHFIADATPLGLKVSTDKKIRLCPYHASDDKGILVIWSKEENYKKELPPLPAKTVVYDEMGNSVSDKPEIVFAPRIYQFEKVSDMSAYLKGL